MLYMLIGRFRSGIGTATRELSAADRGHHSGLKYVGSWVEATLGRSLQVVECENLDVLQQWAARWRHRVEFEVVPILSASDTVTVLEPLLEN